MRSHSIHYTKIFLSIVAIVIVAGLIYYRGDITSLIFPEKKAPPKKNAFQQAQEYLHEEDYSRAYEAFSVVYHQKPASLRRTQALIQMARLAEKMGEENKAMNHWTEVAENKTIAKHHPEAYYRIARYYDAADTAWGGDPDLEKAQKFYRKIYNSYGDDPYAVKAGLRLVELLEQEEQLLEAKKIIDTLRARKIYSADVEKARYRQNIKLLFSPVLTESPKSSYYVIRSGDVLEKIAKKFNTTVELIMESNRIINPARIQIGDRIKVITDKFHVVISKSENTLSLFAEEMLIKKYLVGTGKYGKTPVGSFIIKEKIKNPPWYARGRVIPYGDPENVLGTRWMSIENTDPQKLLTGYGIHGTWETDSVGKQSSQGCIRLVNSEVEELFKIVPKGAIVKIIE